MLHAEASHRRLQLKPMLTSRATQNKVNKLPQISLPKKTIPSPSAALTSQLDVNTELPPISFLSTKPIKKPENQYFTFVKEAEPATPRKDTNHVVTSPVTTMHIEKSLDSMDEIVENSQLKESKNDKCSSEGVLESDEDMPVINKKPRLRIQTDKTKLYRHSFKFNSKSSVDPNVIKRREWMRSLKQLQINSIKNSNVCEQGIQPQQFKILVKEVSNYCARNHFFCYECNESELKIFTFTVDQSKFVVVFKSNTENYDNWGFPKPLYMDGTDICDEELIEKMKKTPTVETFMNELFRIACNVISERVFN
ncbi:Uncharacterized protein QTN25_003854 [Entamoeba marina]